MKYALLFSLYALIALVLLMTQGCDPVQTAAPGADNAPATPSTLVLEGVTYRVSVPHTHENLAVYLLHTDKQDPREFITLDEGLKSGEVKVTEKQSEQVNELLIENTSAKHLFLHEGDRVRGGKQDRTIFTSFVIAPKSAAQPLPSFCIEHNRWTEGANGRQFDATSNAALAPKGVRAAAKVSKNQGEVWDNVANEKENASRNLAAPNTNSSLNETLDAPKIKAISDACAKALSSTIESSEDAVGLAIAINGKIEEVDIYPNHAVLKKISPRLLESYAVQAAQVKKDAQKVQPLEAKAISEFIASGSEKNKREETINAGNSLKVSNFDNKKAQCSTLNDGKVVHWQALSNVEVKSYEAKQQNRADNVQQARQQIEVRPRANDGVNAH